MARTVARKSRKGLYQKHGIWWTGIPHPQTGKRKLLSLGTKDVREAQQFRAALLACSEHRANAHDLVEKVLDGSINLKAFYSAWISGKTDELRAASRDTDLTQHLPGWQTWTQARAKEPVTAQTAGDYLKQIRTLMPEGKGFPLSKLTRRVVEKWLDGLDERSSSTRRRYYAALQSFVKYLRREGVLSVNPLDTVEAPTASPARDRHMTHEQTLKVLERVPAAYRAYFALALGSGMERAALDSLTLSDINAKTRIIRARGTKNAHRDRYVVVSPWAWPHVAEALEGKIGPATKLFSLDYKRALDAFYDAQVAAGYAESSKDAEGEPVSARKARQTKGITMTQFHTLHDCRHTYAVVRLTGQDGEPRADLQTIADQLGHADLQMISRIYARHRSAAQQAAEAAFHGENATVGATELGNKPKIGAA